MALKRFSRDELLLEIAKLVAKRATCLRASVGAVLAFDGRIVSMGYNGAPAGMPHCSEMNCAVEQTCTRTVHAEANTIAFAAKSGIATQGATLYTTHSPCNDCAKLIINAGIVKVIYWQEYRDETPLLLLEEAGVDYDQLGDQF